jgi:hypothetical protein
MHVHCAAAIGMGNTVHRSGLNELKFRINGSLVSHLFAWALHSSDILCDDLGTSELEMKEQLLHCIFLVSALD